MNQKALVEIFLPAVGQRFDVYIPLSSPMWQITALTATALSELSDGKFLASAETVLCDSTTGQIFNMNMSAGELGICSGSRLMLI